MVGRGTPAAPLGVVGFVFEGRPNVFADACGVVRSRQHGGVPDRVGRARHGAGDRRACLAPGAGRRRPAGGAVQLVDEPARRPAMRCSTIGAWRWRWRAVPVRPSPSSGAVAAQAGTPVSLHGTGGAWMIVGEAADRDAVRDAVVNSLDRKVCNTLNVCAIPRVAGRRLVPVFLAALADGRRPVSASTCGCTWSPDRSARCLPTSFERRVVVGHVSGPSDEPFASTIDEAALATEWEWERSPELTLVVTSTTSPHGVALCNRYSPRLRRVGDHRRPMRSSNGATTPSTPRSSATGSPAGSTDSTHSIVRSWASPTGRAAVCSGAARSCPATACSPVRYVARRRPTRPCTADPAGPSEPSTSDGRADGQIQTPLMSTITWVVCDDVTQTAPSADSFTLAPLATGAASR